MTRKKLFLISLIMSIVTINVYLFVSAPEQISNEENNEELNYSSKDLFNILAKINDNARLLYTKQIVQAGQNVGLKFDEKWTEKQVEAGPLPALFLRETSKVIEKNGVQLGLYLGSDFPIAKANEFKGIQKQKFKQLKADKKPKYFLDKTTGKNYAMFPDLAIGNACVNCHNNHKESPKKDWKLNDIMGATTWSVPKDSLTTQELLKYINAYLKASVKTYEKYLDKVENYHQNAKPQIGKKWPEDGYFLPNSEVFRTKLESLHALNSLNAILQKQ